jgi:hypothetical protein
MQNPFRQNATGTVKTVAFVLPFNVTALMEFASTVDLLNNTPRAGFGANVVEVATSYSRSEWPLSFAEQVVKVRATEAILWDLFRTYPAIVIGW